jgi:hypothetical protein
VIRPLEAHRPQRRARQVLWGHQRGQVRDSGGLHALRAGNHTGESTAMGTCASTSVVRLCKPQCLLEAAAKVTAEVQGKLASLGSCLRRLSHLSCLQPPKTCRVWVRACSAGLTAAPSTATMSHSPAGGADRDRCAGPRRQPSLPPARAGPVSTQRQLRQARCSRTASLRAFYHCIPYVLRGTACVRRRPRAFSVCSAASPCHRARRPCPAATMLLAPPARPLSDSFKAFVGGIPWTMDDASLREREQPAAC